MLATGNETIYYENIPMTRWYTICIYMHLASRRSWRRHRRNWRCLRGVHRAVMGSVVVTKVVIGPIGIIDSSGLRLRGTWTVQVSTCAIYNTLHTLHGASHKFYGCSGGKTKCLSATLLQRFLQNYWSDLVRQLREKDEAPWHLFHRSCFQVANCRADCFDL